MIDHIVLLEPKPVLTGSDVAAMRTAITALQQKIPGIAAIHWGPNISPEGLGRGYEHGFVVRFVDAAARDAYLPHPEHLAVIPELTTRADNILVFDIEHD